MNKHYQNRKEAGQCLANLLKSQVQKQDAYVLALPRGGVPVAYEIAKKLSLPLDVFVVRKIGLPLQEEYAVGATAAGKVILNHSLMNVLQVNQEDLQEIIVKETQELKRREKIYRGTKPYPNFQGQTVVVVDDGIATGYTMRAALDVLKSYKPAKLIVAVPVAPPDVCEELCALGVNVICPLKPTLFQSVGTWYQDFQQTSDEEVLALLKEGS